MRGGRGKGSEGMGRKKVGRKKGEQEAGGGICDERKTAGDVRLNVVDWEMCMRYRSEGSVEGSFSAKLNDTPT
jgi:hypothetical protein